jgi:hypothetical protein
MRSFVVTSCTALAIAILAAGADAGPPWGPETPPFNLEAVLEPTAIGPETAFGLVKFRQPNDAETTVHLHVWVRDLLPNHTYLVQRATDMNPVNDDCTGSNWAMPNLGTITTDDRGTGRADLLRPLPAALLGTEFDIHFRIAETATATAGVLESGCYQFVVSR